MNLEPLSEHQIYQLGNVVHPVSDKKPEGRKTGHHKTGAIGIGLSNETYRCDYCGRAISVTITQEMHLESFDDCREQMLKEKVENSRPKSLLSSR